MRTIRDKAPPPPPPADRRADMLKNPRKDAPVHGSLRVRRGRLRTRACVLCNLYLVAVGTQMSMSQS